MTFLHGQNKLSKFLNNFEKKIF